MNDICTHGFVVRLGIVSSRAADSSLASLGWHVEPMHELCAALYATAGTTPAKRGHETSWRWPLCKAMVPPAHTISSPSPPTCLQFFGSDQFPELSDNFRHFEDVRGCWAVALSAMVHQWACHSPAHQNTRLFFVAGTSIHVNPLGHGLLSMPVHDARVQFCFSVTPAVAYSGPGPWHPYT